MLERFLNLFPSIIYLNSLDTPLKKTFWEQDFKLKLTMLNRWLKMAYINWRVKDNETLVSTN